jgi:hypothetical protein
MDLSAVEGRKDGGSHSAKADRRDVPVAAIKANALDRHPRSLLSRAIFFNMTMRERREEREGLVSMDKIQHPSFFSFLVSVSAPLPLNFIFFLFSFPLPGRDG